MTDGLAELREKRKAATSNRHLPPAKHRQTPKPTPAHDTPNDPEVSTPPAAAAEPPTPRTTTPMKTSETKKPATELVRQTVYLDEAADDLLEDVRSASRRRRVDANRSAVIRLALRRIADELTPEQIVAEIEKASKAAGAQRPGRRLV